MAVFGIKRKRAQGATAAHEAALVRLDKLGPLLGEHEHHRNQSRPEQLTIRILTMTTGLFGATTVLSLVALTQMQPLHTVVPYLITFSDKADQMVRIDAPTGRLSSMGIVLANEVRQYMMQRYTVSGDTQETVDRWNTKIQPLSSGRVFAEFQAETAPIRELMRAGGYTRSIVIVNIASLEPGSYRIDFDTYDHTAGAGIADTKDVQQKWSATMKVSLEAQLVPRSTIYLNPFGFRVYQYVVSERHS